MENQISFDQVIYDPGFQLDGAHLVEASAGTGKTYNIQNIYARLIMEKGLKGSEILVMTYTDAATKELRDRLHTVLKDIQRRFAGQECLGKNPSDTQARNERADRLIGCVTVEKRSQARANIELALLEFDKSTISTIHGFCQRALSRFAFEAGVNLTPTIEDNKVADLHVMAEDWWRKRPADMPEDVTLNSLEKYIGDLSSKADYEIQTGSLDVKEGYMLDVAQKIIKRYEAMRDERKALNFDDLLRALRDALKDDQPRSGYLIEQLRKEFKAALIDEFQDTDPVQFEIFVRVFLNGNSNPLFFVGDPKQAIYAFRGADIYTYLKAKATPGLSRFSLGVNFRSTKRMIDAINGMFQDTAGKRTFGLDAIPYEAVDVTQDPKTKGGVQDKPLRIVNFPVQKSLSLETHLAQILPSMVKQITELLGEQKEDEDGKKVPVFSPGDIAILTRSNKLNREIHGLLQRAHIPSVVRRSGNVFASPVAKELWLFLQGVSNPSDKAKVRCAAVTVFGGSTVFGIADFAEPAVLAQYLERFRELNGKYQKRGLSALVADLESATDHNYRQRLANREDGERLLADMNQIWELCFAAVKQHRMTLDELTTWLDERIVASAAGETDSEEYAREMESDSNAVKIMTIHVAKGLQFPVVFLPDCWGLVISLNRPYEYHSDNGLVFSAEKDASGQANAENFQEKIRLYYVALTRAVERMVVFAPQVNTDGLSAKDITTARNKVQRTPLSILLSNLRGNCVEEPPFEEVPITACGKDGVYTPVTTVLDWRGASVPPEFDTRPTKGSFSSLFHGKTATDMEAPERDVDAEVADPLAKSTEDDGAAAHPIFGIHGGADIGTFWHNILEKVPFDADADAIRAITQKELRESGFPEEILEPTVEMIAKVLEYPMSAVDGTPFSLRGIPWEERLSEQEFDFASALAQADTGALKAVLERHWGADASKSEFLRAFTEEQYRRIPKGFLTGFVDLIFRHGDFFYIIDWKSNSIGGKVENFNEDGVGHEMAKHLYFFQYLLYAVVLHNHLKQTMGEQYSWEKNFGGIRYFFLRGIAAGGVAPVFVDRPSEAMLEELGEVFGLSVKGGK